MPKRRPRAPKTPLYSHFFALRVSKCRQKVAVIGHNGAGKSTLVKLLLGFYQPQDGYILINGRRLDQYDRRALLRAVGVVFQDHRLFNALSLGENVLMREVGAEDVATVLSALERVGLKEKVVALPRSIHTALSREFDDSGVELSGGERQRLVWARAYTKDAVLWIFDEPTSALDPIGEQQFFDIMWNLAEDRTVLYVSHRLANVARADVILVFRAGELVEQGNHSELMDRKGIYAALYALQASKYAQGGREELEGAEANEKRATGS